MIQLHEGNEEMIKKNIASKVGELINNNKKYKQ